MTKVGGIEKLRQFPVTVRFKKFVVEDMNRRFEVRCSGDFTGRVDGTLKM